MKWGKNCFKQIIYLTNLAQSLTHTKQSLLCSLFILIHKQLLMQNSHTCALGHDAFKWCPQTLQLAAESGFYSSCLPWAWLTHALLVMDAAVTTVKDVGTWQRLSWEESALVVLRTNGSVDMSLENTSCFCEWQQTSQIIHPATLACNTNKHTVTDSVSGTLTFLESFVASDFS